MSGAGRGGGGGAMGMFSNGDSHGIDRDTTRPVLDHVVRPSRAPSLRILFTLCRHTAIKRTRAGAVNKVYAQRIILL